MPNLTGQSIGRYHILEQLGEGGMATVYKAYDTRLERDVAVKVLRTDQFIPAQLEMVLQRFEREAKSLAKLKHANIVNILDFGEHEGRPYLVMEYLPGGTLKQQLGQAVPWPRVFDTLLPVARGLAYAHQHNLIHRDVKPANILIDENKDPILTDFGIAKLLEGAEGHTLTGTGVGLGTPEYMAPEQGMGASSIDARADIYSLGIVLYEMVTGRKPYMADTPMAVVLKQMTDPLPRPTDFVPDLPGGVEHILFKALAKQPEDRYADMNALIAAMESLLAGSPKAEAPPVAIPARQVQEKAVPRTKNSRKVVTAIIGTLGAVVLIVLGIMLAPRIGGYLNSAPTSTPRPNITNLTASATTLTHTPPAATETPIPAWITNFAEPILDVVKVRKPDFADDFSMVKESWDSQFGIGSDSVGTFNIEDGVMRFRINQGNATFTNQELEARDFVLQVNSYMTKGEKGSSQQIYFKWVFRDYWYAIFLNTDGQPNWEVIKRWARQDHLLASGTNHINPVGEMNRVTIIVNRLRVAIYLNNIPVASFEDDEIGVSGYDKYFTCVATSQTVCVFDNLEFWNLRGIPNLP